MIYDALTMNNRHHEQHRHAAAARLVAHQAHESGANLMLNKLLTRDKLFGQEGSKMISLPSLAAAVVAAAAAAARGDLQHRHRTPHSITVQQLAQVFDGE